MTIYTIAVLTIFPAMMIYAALMDMFTMTIPNVISLVLIAGFAMLAPFSGLTLGQIGIHAAVALGVLAAGMGIFAMGWIGGGDVKLFASISLWFGLGNLMEFALMASIYGGLLAMGIYMLRRWELPTVLAGQSWLTRIHGEINCVPYGVALAAGALHVFPHTLWVTKLAA